MLCGLQEALIFGHSIERGFLILGPVYVGQDVVVGPMSVVMPETSLDNGVKLATASMVPLATSLAPETTWEGVPVRPRDGPLLAYKKEPVTGISRRRTRAKIGREGGQQTGNILPSASVQAIQTAGALVSVAATWVALLPAAAGAVLLWRVRNCYAIVFINFLASISKNKSS